MNQGPEIQLRIVQTLLLMMTYCSGVHQDVLGEVSPGGFQGDFGMTDLRSSIAVSLVLQASGFQDVSGFEHSICFATSSGGTGLREGA